MSVYVYEHDGVQIEREYPIGKAPQSVRVNGKTYKRALTAPVVHMADHVSGRDVRYVSHSLGPQHYQFHKGAFVNGRPAINGIREQRDIELRAADAGVKLRYGKPDAPKALR